MSIKAFKWAMEQHLPPSHKLVLVSFADNANESGECWPGLMYVAERCGLSRRTVRRIVCALEKQKLLRTTPRFRKDGSCRSNLYVLSVPGEDTLSQSPDTGNPSTGQSKSRGNDSHDRPRTTSNSKIESPLQATTDPSGSFQRMFIESEGRCSRTVEFKFPPDLLLPEINQLKEHLKGLSPTIAQDALFELEGRMKNGSIRGNALSYFSGILKSIKDDTFKMQAGIRVKQKYRAKEKAEAAALAAKDSFPPIHATVADNPYADRIAKIRELSNQRAGEKV